MTPPNAEQLDHLIGHTDHRSLTPDEHARLRAGIQQLRASLAGTGAALRRAPSGAYVNQLQQQAARASRYRSAWHNARRRAVEFSTALGHTVAAAERGCDDLARIAHDQLTRAETAEAERDGAYRERAHLTAWLATVHPAVITPATDIDEPGWQILYITAGGRQLSWHIHPQDADLYAHVEHVQPDDPRALWDGHTTEQKYAAIREMTFGELRGCPVPAPSAHT
jgi:hypothetical protein